MKQVTFLAVAIAAFFFISFSSNTTPDPDRADKIFINGKVITLDAKNSISQALAVKNGRILAVGSTTDINKLKASETVVIDLAGKTLLPGFIDGHSHFMSLSSGSGSVNLAPPPVGRVKNIADIVAALKKKQKEKNIKPGEWIIGSRYDQDQLAEGRHPNKEDLDAAFPDNPVSLGHNSGHLSVVNSYALKISGINASTKDPAGGTIVRKQGTQEPTGLLLERARNLIKRGEDSKPLSREEQLAQLDKQQKLYASYGITTAQDGSSSISSLELLQDAANRKRLYIDIEALAAYPSLQRAVANPKFEFNKMNNHFKIAGTKIFTDGSPQGKTAFFSKPYLTEVPGCHEHCTGIPTTTQEKLNEALLFCFKNNIQPYTHCNGDGAIDMYLKAVEQANTKYQGVSTRLRPVIIHSQFVRPDQLDSYKKLGMIPSFFTNHAFFWGDVHVRNLGKERAFFLSPTKTTLKKNIVFTNHTDFGVTPINQLFLLWSSVARESRSGQIIGPNERLTVMEGLKAITINGAYQYSEEKIKGSLEKGKLADLIILSDDPTTVQTSAIKDIQVLETIKEGKTIYKRK